MKKFIILSISLVTFIISSQEMDQAYLESLPEGVRADVIGKMSAKEEMEEPVYRRASSMIDRPVNSSRFGSNIFDMMQSSFMPINEPNFESSYVLDFGDIISVQLIGQKNFLKKIPVERDGSINIPDIGKLFLSGLSLESASELIKAKIQNAFIGTEVFVSLVDVRDIQIVIAGMAYNPGIYTLNGNSNALHAISMAGGLLDSGSYRNIDIIRNGKVIETLDLYDLFIYGNSSFGPKLTSGDSIFVRPVGKIVNATVGVRRPSEYELVESDTVGDLIYFANGLSKISDTDYLAIERASNNKVNLLTFEDIEVFYKEIPQDGDTIFIREFSYRTVNIKGAVSVPGDYIIIEGESLSNLINRAGGYKEFAYPFGGFLNNERARQVNEEAKNKLYDSFLQNIIEKSSTDQPDTNLPLVLEQLRNAEVSGRVMAEFDLNIISKNKDLDTTLENGDEIIIPYVTQQVYIYGEVNSSGTLRYTSGKDIQYYIENSGGFLESADTKNIYVVHPNGKTQRLDKYPKGLSFINSPEYIPIYPGSIIYVSKKSYTNTPTLIASIWAPIISSIALSIASVSALNN
tara:strand:+ start:2003 stop:3724 length:1722 start_codon:yes stop_codon:yes gene_type:complete